MYSYWFFVDIDLFPTALEAYNFISGHIQFKIEKLISDKSYIISNIYNYLEVISEFGKNNDQKFTLCGNELATEDFEKVIFRKEYKRQLAVFIIDILAKKNFELDKFIADLSKTKFSNGYLIDWSKAQWQSQVFLHQFKTFNHPFPKNYQIKTDLNFGTVIDIFFNPGHVGKVKYMNLYASPEMWFGEKALSFFKKDKLLSFPDALEAKELCPNMVYVKLFDFETQDWEIEEILNVQKKFRNWVEMDKVEQDLMIL